MEELEEKLKDATAFSDAQKEDIREMFRKADVDGGGVSFEEMETAGVADIAAAVNNNDTSAFMKTMFAGAKGSKKEGAKQDLHPAVVSGNSLMLCMMIERGADILMENEGGQTPLEAAVQNEKWECANMLCAKMDADIGAKQAKYEALARKQLKALGFPDPGDEDKGVREAFFTAMEAGDDLAAISCIYSRSFNPNSPHDGTFPLHCAAKKDNLFVICCLADVGAKVLLKDSEGNYALDIALEHKNPECSYILAAKVANLMQAFLGREKKVAKKDASADAEKAAADRKHLVEVISKIDGPPAPAELCDILRLAEALHTESRKDKKTGNVILKINEPLEDDGMTVLHHASKCGECSVAGVLLQCGADVLMLTHPAEGLPALSAVDIAVKEKKWDMAKMLGKRLVYIIEPAKKK